MDFLTNFISIIFDNLLDIIITLDSDIRKDVFIGVTGLTAAIIIFIAEVVSNKEYEIEKKVILKKTEMISNMKLCVFIFLLMLLSTLIDSTYNTEGISYIQNDYLYLIIQIILDYYIFKFMYKTIKIFIITVKLNTNKEYFSQKLDEYIVERTTEIEQTANNKSLENIYELKTKFNEYLANNQYLSNSLEKYNQNEYNYIPIYSYKDGIIKSYDYKKIDSILDNINISSPEDLKEYLSPNLPLFIFTKQIGDKIKKNNIIGYCLKSYKKYFEEISKCLIYDHNNIYLDEETKSINDDLFKMINESFKEPREYDDNNKLLTYFEYLYSNNLQSTKTFAFYELDETTKELSKDEYKNPKYISFLNHLLSLSFNNDNYEDYKHLNNLIFTLYYNQFNYNNNYHKIAYDFTNRYFKYNYFSVIKNNNLIYYDNLLSNLLKFIALIIKNNSLNTLPIIFDNLILKNNLSNKELNKLNIQFSLGITLIIMNYLKENKPSKEEVKYLKDLIKWTHKHFIHIYNSINFILDYKSLYNEETSIKESYNYIIYIFINKEYQNTISFIGVNEIELLRTYICYYDLDYLNEEFNLNKITKDDKQYYEHILNTFNIEESIYEQKLNLTFNNKYNNLLNTIIKEATIKEDEYNQNHSLNKEKLNNFKSIIVNKISTKTPLENYLESHNKIEYPNIKIKRIHGLNRLLSRNLFINNDSLESVANHIGERFNTIKEDEFIKTIDEISIYNNKSLNTLLNELKDISSYLLITNYDTISSLPKEFNYDITKPYIIVNNNKLDILVLSTTNTYLIKIDNLPILQYCNFTTNYQDKYISNNIYYELQDCSTNEELRKEIIEESSYLQDKGNIIEQNIYLKNKCRLKIYLSYRYYKIKDASSIKIDS